MLPRPTSAGNTATQNFNFTFGAAPLDPPDLDNDDDTGADNADDSTSQISDLTFSGDNAEPNATITITATRTTPHHPGAGYRDDDRRGRG